MTVLAEIEMLLNVYGVKEISFEDDYLSTDAGRLEAICREAIHRNLRFKWNTPNGIAIQNLTRPLLRWMIRSGCTRLNFGIESGDPAILELMNKKLSLDKIREVIREAHEEGIVTLGYFVLGVPGETVDSVRRTIDFATSLPLDEIGLFIATPFPGTTMTKEAKEKGYLKKEFNTITAEDDIEELVFMETPTMSKEQLADLKREFFSAFYRKKVWKRPWYFAGRALKQPTLIRRFIWQK